jgi:polysaccharide deacetylase family protein (PEP-CTERM system associated)
MSVNTSVVKQCDVLEVRRPSAADAPVCAFTVDVEDWYQSSIDFDAPITHRVVDNVHRVLDLLDQRNTKATFFVQGLVAEAFPGLLQFLLKEGHEIQSHGYSHRPLYKMDPPTLRCELERARKSVEDASGTRVTAFRAPDFSIVSSNLWALESLAENGFTVDSSIFPLRIRRYGIAHWPSSPHLIRLASGAKMLEIPVATWELLGKRLPVSGGGYFRLLPVRLLTAALKRMIATEGPPVIYCHPYEFNAHELDEYRHRVSGIYRLYQGTGRAAFLDRVNTLLGQLRFGRFDHVMAAWGLL